MNTIRNQIADVTVLVVIILSMLTSCYDDSSIKNKFDEIDNRLDSLELSLNGQIQALSAILDGRTTVTSSEKNSDGSFRITLSNGIRFIVFPDSTDYSAFVSVITIDGTRYWATYDKDGKPISLTDAAGKPVPVVNEYKTQVEVIVEDGVYYLMIDGKKYMTGYDTEDLVQVFSSCTQLKDASGNVYAMTFTFGDGIKVTVAVDGYNGVIFRLPNMVNAEVVTEYFICNGDTQSLLLDETGVIDYLMQIPDGWRITEREDGYTGDKYIDITAPAAETVESGAAAAEGELKLVAVIQGGKAAVSKVMLSSNPFKTFEVNGSKAVIEPYIGVQKFVYGVTEKSNFDENALISSVNTLLQTTGDIPAGYGIGEGSVDIRHTDTYGKVLDNNIEYVFWALPALYREGDDAGFYVKAGTFRTYCFSSVNVKFGKTTASTFDAEINVDFSGVGKIYGGTLKMTEDVFSEILHLVNNNAYTPIDAPASYSGPASAFPSRESNSETVFTYGTRYLSWIIPYQEGKTTYTANDIVYTTFTTDKPSSGSYIKITYGEATTTQTSISIPVSSQGAEMISYLFMDESEGERISTADNDTKAELIFENPDCMTIKGNSVTAQMEQLFPETTMYLYAVAVDKNGKYGVVNQKIITTTAVGYSGITVSVTTLEVGTDYASFGIEVTGGDVTDYVYWFGKYTDDFWQNPSYLSDDLSIASQYMAFYPQDEHIVRSMKTYGKITDGILRITDLTPSVEYVLVVTAKDTKGRYTKAGYKKIETLDANIGTVFRKGSAEWEAAKAAVVVNWTRSKFVKDEFYSYGFRYSGPTDLTAYIVCASDEYFDNDSALQGMEAKIIEIERLALKPTTDLKYPKTSIGDYIFEPTWYDPNGKMHSGGIAVVADFYVHGNPTKGTFAYFAAGSHDKYCSRVNDGVCSTYLEVIEKINSRLTIEAYLNKFREYYVMENNEECIAVAAQQLLDFYYPLYKDKVPLVFENNGEAIDVYQHYGSGPDSNVGKLIDDVFIVLKDNNGNYYEPMKYEVPPLW